MSDTRNTLVTTAENENILTINYALFEEVDLDGVFDSASESKPESPRSKSLIPASAQTITTRNSDSKKSDLAEIKTSTANEQDNFQLNQEILIQQLNDELNDTPLTQRKTPPLEDLLSIDVQLLINLIEKNLITTHYPALVNRKEDVIHFICENIKKSEFQNMVLSYVIMLFNPNSPLGQFVNLSTLEEDSIKSLKNILISLTSSLDKKTNDQELCKLYVDILFILANPNDGLFDHLSFAEFSLVKSKLRLLQDNPVKDMGEHISKMTREYISSVESNVLATTKNRAQEVLTFIINTELSTQDKLILMRNCINEKDPQSSLLMFIFDHSQNIYLKIKLLKFLKTELDNNVVLAKSIFNLLHLTSPKHNSLSSSILSNSSLIEHYTALIASLEKTNIYSSDVKNLRAAIPIITNDDLPELSIVSESNKTISTSSFSLTPPNVLNSALQQPESSFGRKFWGFLKRQ